MTPTTLKHIISTLLILIGLLACTATDTQPAPLTVQLAWTHSAQFAGLYAADQQGYYADEGLAIIFSEGGGEVGRLLPVLTGAAQLGLASPAELILARAQGEPVRAVAAVFRRDPYAFFALTESGITRPEDFAGKTIQIRERGRPILHAVTSRVDLSPDQYREDYQANFADLYTGRVDVAVGFITAQQIEAEWAGYQLNVIYPDDYGVHFYTDVIFTTDEFIEANPQLVARFLRASLKGWTYAVENPAQAGMLVTNYNPQADEMLENEKMLASLPLINTGQDYIGWMKSEEWEGMVTTLHQYGALPTPVAIDELYTLQFLQEIYQH